jgi:hypothetical protein
MTQLVVISGVALATHKDGIEIATLSGQVITIPLQAIVKQAPIDTGKDALTRYFLDPEADLTISIKAKAFAIAGPRGGWDTIYKYLDDGGTPSKSQDDLGTPSKSYDDGGGTGNKDFDDGGTGDKDFDDGDSVARSPAPPRPTRRKK